MSKAMATAASVIRPASVVLADQTSDLVQVFELGVSAVIYPRRLTGDLLADVEQLISTVAARKVVVSVTDASPAGVASALGVPPALGADIAFWVGLVAEICDVPLVGIRLARCEAPMCPQFHTDRVMLRAVLTYVGPGTEVLAAGAERWCAGAGDLVLLKGELWPSEVGAAVHRSPGHDGPRLVLTLDPLS